MEVGIREVKTQCSAIIELAHRGERIVITKHGVPWADIVPHPATAKKRYLGPLPGITGRISTIDAIAPLKPEELAEWE